MIRRRFGFGRQCRSSVALAAGLALWAAGSGLAHASAGLGTCEGPIDLTGFSSIVDDDFGTLRTVERGEGPWTSRSARGTIATNGPRSVFLNADTTAPDGSPIGLDPFDLKDGILSIKGDRIPSDRLPAVREKLIQTGQERFADRTQYYTGRLSTWPTLAQTYGYFEIRAKIPEGRGYWPAFWLAPATSGWPPEIDVMEAYGLTRRGNPHDHRFIVAVYFDAIDVAGEPTQSVDVVNPDGAPEGEVESPEVINRGQRTYYRFKRQFNAREAFDRNIYQQYHTFAAAWTPENVTFYFGPERDSLRPIYRTPTPPDVQSNMVVIINNQISTRWGWNPVRSQYDMVFAPENAFKVDHVRVAMLEPRRLTATPSDDLLYLGDGQERINLEGGADVVVIERAVGNKLIDGFGEDDTLVLDGFPFASSRDALANAFQVGEDTWLTAHSMADGAQTIILRGVTKGTLDPDAIVVRWPITEPVWWRRDRDAKVRRDASSSGRVEAGVEAARLTDGGVKGPVTLVGSPAGDLYLLRKKVSTIIETEGGGVDTIRTNVDVVLPDHVENVEAARPGLSLIGNSLGNRLVGSEAGERFDGRDGDDLIILGGGADTVIIRPGDGHDKVVGFGPNDRLAIEGLAFESYAGLAERLEARGDATALSLGADSSVILSGVSPDTLGPDNFILSASGRPASQAAAIPFSRPEGPTVPTVTPMAEAYGGPCAPGPLPRLPD